jgi:ribosome-associated heat shock protein Hsp15
MTDSAGRVRIDKWLWAARFYKTRTLAAGAVDAGHVQLNRMRVKPSKEVRTGDMLDILVGEVSRTVTVRAMGERRGTAQQAAALYEETAESLQVREKARDLRRFTATPGDDLQGRPTKRDRRVLDRFRRG